MAITNLWFGVSGSGAQDASSFGNRAALYNAGWSALLTAGSATNAIHAIIEAGTHTIGAALSPGSFTNPPTAARPLYMSGCDTSGNLLSAPDPDWFSAMPGYSESSFPVLATTGNFATINSSNNLAVLLRMLKFTATGRTGGGVVSAAQTDWCVVESSASNTSAVGIANPFRADNCIVRMTGTSFSAAITSFGDSVRNCRLEGYAGSASSGNRNGISTSSTTGPEMLNNTIIGFPGHGIAGTSTNVAQWWRARFNTIVNCGGDGLRTNSTASQNAPHLWEGNYISGCTGYAVNAQSAGIVVLSRNRMRDNGSGNTNGMGNALDVDNYTTDSDDATEFADATNRDYRIRPTAAIWSHGFGAGRLFPGPARSMD